MIAFVIGLLLGMLLGTFATALLSIIDAWDGYENRDPLKMALALLWAFAAGLHFSQVVVPA